MLFAERASVVPVLLRAALLIATCILMPIERGACSACCMKD